LKITTAQRRRLNALLREILIRRDGEKCLRCPNRNRVHASHIYPKGKYRGLQFDPDNLKFLCYHCHIYFWHKNPIEAYKWIRTAIPKDRLKRLEAKAKRTIKVEPYEKIKAKLEAYLDKEGA
jgi:5-methylcytosine-specific restriction endonuclease McrA